MTYTYDTTNKWQLKSIVGNDGTGTPRTITLTYITPGSTASPLVSTVLDGTRTWTYQYGAPNGQGPLQSVTLPDNSSWQLAGLAALTNSVSYLGDGNCEGPGMANPYSLSGTAIHPSGALGEFVSQPGPAWPRRGAECMPKVFGFKYGNGVLPEAVRHVCVNEKTMGAGLPVMEWNTTYSGAVSGWAPWNGQDGSKQVEVRGPEGHVTRHTFGTVYLETEGQLQLVEQIDAYKGSFAARQHAMSSQSRRGA